MCTTTRWSAGTVTNTCQDVWIDGWGGEGIRCSYKSNMHVDEGDSGGPVFAWDTQDGIIASGIVFAMDDDHNGWFSKWMNVRNELVGGPSYYLDPLTDVSIGSETMSATVTTQHPNLSWNVLTTTNSILTTTYYVWRETGNGNVTNENLMVFSSTSATSWRDNSQFVKVAVYSSPPAGAWVAYHVTAYNSGQSTSSARKYMQNNLQ